MCLDGNAFRIQGAWRSAALLGGLSEFIAPGWLRTRRCEPECSWTRGVGGEERSTCPTPKTGVQWRVAAAVRGARLTIRVCLPACGDPCRTISAPPPLSAFPRTHRLPSAGVVPVLCPAAPHAVSVPHPFSFLPRSRSFSLLRPVRAECRPGSCLASGQRCPWRGFSTRTSAGIWVEPYQRWCGRGSSCSPTVGINYNRAAQLDSARRRATPSGAFDAARSPRSDILPEAAPVMGGAPFPGLIGEPRRRHCFRRGMLRNAARARFTPTPGVATPLSHATPLPAVARRRRRPRRPPVSFSIYLRRAVPPGFFMSTR